MHPLAKPRRPRVYFGRAIHGLPELEIRKLSHKVSGELDQHGFDIIDPFVLLRDRPGPAISDYINTIRFDLAILFESDALLVDMTVPERNYVGCTCEIVYAHLARIPVVVYVGETQNGEQKWLKYHTGGIFKSRREALEHLQQKFQKEPA